MSQKAAQILSTTAIAGNDPTEFSSRDVLEMNLRAQV
jgi:hypothetical protein